ncbi:MAG: hypothetical protein AAF387_01630 [Pseudomonadota bacterium]
MQNQTTSKAKVSNTRQIAPHSKSITRAVFFHQGNDETALNEMHSEKLLVDFQCAVVDEQVAFVSPLHGSGRVRHIRAQQYSNRRASNGFHSKFLARKRVIVDVSKADCSCLGDVAIGTA